ncbi:MAG: 4-hydroxy-tetrahydrodipicolinate reductase [Xanthomonadales bacterium]|nr:4-hydroxy-tetrahydrodipicolinate reductase [Xanthomonadales bacterium]
MTHFVIHGGGRMARQVCLAVERSGNRLEAVVARRRPEWLGDTPWVGDFDALTQRPDVVIDFTLTGGTAAAATWARLNLVALVSGTTALDDADLRALERAAELVPVLWSPNLARGPNQLYDVVHRTAHALGTSAGVRIDEIHHVHKKDAPSGTALWLAQAVASAWGRQSADLLRTGVDADALPSAGEVLCSSERTGEVVGTHRVTFYTETDRLSYTHEARDRAIFAQGSVEAANWLLNQPAGLYSGAHWLGAIGEPDH